MPAQGRARWDELVLQVRTDHHHVANPLEVAGAEEAPLGDLEAAHRKELGRHPGDRGTGREGSGLHHLREGDLGRHAPHGGHLLLDRFGIFKHQGLGAFDPLAAGVIAARHYEQHIGAEAAQLALRQVLGPFAHPHQGDHRGIADHDAQHREKAAEPVCGQGGEGHPDGLADR